MEKANTKPSNWRSSLAFSHTVVRLICSITGLSIALGVGMQALLQNQQNTFARMFLIAIATFVFVTMDYRNLQSPMESTE
jgi:hypothetical protein